MFCLWQIHPPWILPGLDRAVDFVHQGLLGGSILVLCKTMQVKYILQTKFLNFNPQQILEITIFSIFLSYSGSHHSANEQQPYGFPRGLFPCPQCSKVYQYKYTLATHLRFECGKEPQFQCPYCPHRTKLKGNLMKHVRKIHANVISSDSSHILHPPLQNPVAQISHSNMISKWNYPSLCSTWLIGKTFNVYFLLY